MSGKKGKGRKSRRGMLGSFKYDSARSGKNKSKSTPRKVLEWIGGGVAIAAMGFVLVLLVWRMFSPNYGVVPGEGTFEAVRIEEYENPLPVRDGEAARVATATVEIEGYEIELKLTAEQLVAVRDGAGIRARYTRRPFRSGIRINVNPDDWYVEGVGDPPDWATDPD